MTVNNAPKAAAGFNDIMRNFKERYQKASKLIITIKFGGIGPFNFPRNLLQEGITVDDMNR